MSIKEVHSIARWKIGEEGLQELRKLGKVRQEGWAGEQQKFRCIEDIWGLPPKRQNT